MKTTMICVLGDLTFWCRQSAGPGEGLRRRPSDVTIQNRGHRRTRCNRGERFTSRGLVGRAAADQAFRHLGATIRTTGEEDVWSAIGNYMIGRLADDGIAKGTRVETRVLLDRPACSRAIRFALSRGVGSGPLEECRSLAGQTDLYSPESPKPRAPEPEYRATASSESMDIGDQFASIAAAALAEERASREDLQLGRIDALARTAGEVRVAAALHWLHRGASMSKERRADCMGKLEMSLKAQAAPVNFDLCDLGPND